MRLEGKPPHEFVRPTHPEFWGLILTEYNRQFKEVPQPIHSIEVNACSTDEKQRAVLDDTTYLSVRERERFSKDARCGRSRAKIEGLLRTRLIRPAIEDEFAVAIEKVSELGATGFTAE